MMNKKLLALGLGAIITASVSTATMATGMTLTSSGASADILVNCNGYPGLQNVPANGSIGPFPWLAIAVMFHDYSFGPIPCTFKLNNKTQDLIGSATLTPTATTGEITNVVPASSYTVSITPGVGVPSTTMTVELKAK